MASTTARRRKVSSLISAIAFAISVLVPLSAPVFAASAAGSTAVESTVKLDHNSIIRALLWMRTSGEYEALCRQTFNTALQRVRQAIKTRKSTKPAAVIMDLDETVLDNSGYSIYLLTRDLRHHEGHWHRWNRQNIDRVGLVPGARSFIKEVEKEGVRVVFVSNRSNALRDTTIKILLRLDVAARAELADPNAVKLLLRDKSSSKRSRRDIVLSKYDVIALLGDNLNDFSDEFRSPGVDSIDARRAAVRRHTDQWGTRWFVLPNPIYGYWTRFINWDDVEHHFERPNR